MLTHRGFAMLGEPLFRRAEADGTPVMVVTLGERQAALPLRSLQREFGIADEAPDGRMLAQIAAALEYVAALRLGDPLPLEVSTGEASWAPEATHLASASIRLRLQLVAWLNAGSATDDPPLDAEALQRAAEDPVVRRQVQDALDQAATALGLSNQEAVVALLEDLAQELAFVEALRDRLLRRVQAMALKIERMARAWRGDASQTETLTQVRRLTGVALKQILRRFEELDAQTGEVMATLRNAGSQRAFIRAHRDWLYRSQRAWQAVLAEWDGAGMEFTEATRALLLRTYRFLAPRFMPVTEWISATNPERKKPTVRQMMW
jgi:hypothetical protein